MSQASAQLPLQRDQLGPTPVIVITDHSLPLVRFAIALRGGAWRDPLGRAGAMRLLGELLLRGTEQLDRRQFNAALEAMGSPVGVATTGEAMVLRGVCHRRYLEQTLELCFAALATPALADEEREALRDELVAGLFADRDEDDAVAELFLRRALYGEHRLARSPQGEVADLNLLTGEEVRASHRGLVAASNAVVLLGGDITPETAAGLLAEPLARLPTTGAAWPVLPPPGPPQALELWLVDKPERTQVQLRLAAFGPTGTAPEALAFAVGVTAFGRTFTSTLTREVRDIRGWSYVAHASFDRRGLLPSPLVLRSASATGDALPCLALQLELLSDLARGRLAPEALAFARDYLANREPLERQSCADLMPAALRLELLGEPLERLYQTPVDLAALELDTVGPVMEQYLTPERVAVTLVATAAEVEAELNARFPAARRRTVDFRDGLGI